MAESGTNIQPLEKAGNHHAFIEEVMFCEWLSQQLRVSQRATLSSWLLLGTVFGKTSRALTWHISVSTLLLVC